MTELIRAKTDADFLAMVPHLLGFRPEKSVVLVGFRGKRTHGALRLDLPDTAVAHKKLAAFALGTMSKIPGLEGIAVVVFGAQGVSSGEPLPYADFARVLNGRIMRSALDLRGCWGLFSNGWGAYDDSATEIRSLNEIELSGVAINSGSPPALPAMTLPEASDADKKRVAAALAQYRELELLGNFRPDALKDVAVFVERALDWDESEQHRFGALLLYAVQEGSFRDASMLQWASSLHTAQAQWSNDFSSTSSVDLMIGKGPRPKRERVEKAIALLRHLVAIANDEERRAPLCMLAWLHWAIGQGSVGGRYVDMALAVDPAYGLGRLLDTMMRNGWLPEWSFSVEESIADVQTCAYEDDDRHR